MSETKARGGYSSGSYWRQRSDALYYSYVDYIMRVVARDAKSMIDVGTGNCPYLDWFDWIEERVSVDIRVPYQSEEVTGIVGDIHDLTFEKRFNVCTCLQVLEHVPDAAAFSQRLLELADLLVVSVPFNWSTEPERVKGHIHDPVDYAKLTNWMGRKANFHIVAKEPFAGDRGRRLIALYDRDPERRFGKAERDNRLPPRSRPMDPQVGESSEGSSQK